MSKRQEDFDTQSDKYVEMRKSFGVNDPYALKEIGEAHYQGAEHGYQYAVDKTCEWLADRVTHDSIDYPMATGHLTNDYRKAMED